MSMQVGFVTSVQGTDVIIGMYEDSNKITYRYNGELYHGVAIREYISIKTGIYDIVCKVEGEYLDEKSYDFNAQRQKLYTRKVEVKPIGYLENGKFREGAKYLPMIMDNAYLMTDKELSSIYNSNTKYSYVIGKTLSDDIPYSIDFNVLFNKHIGVFGNTGSGKSNTLTKLYTDLFLKYKDNIIGKSHFILFDFNGEYTGKQIIDDPNDKKIIKLNSGTSVDKIEIAEDCFWDEDILSLLFKATSNTQRPFIKRLVEGRKWWQERGFRLLEYYNRSIDNFFDSPNQKKEIKELFISIIELIYKADNDQNSIGEDIVRAFDAIIWHGVGQYFYYDSCTTNLLKDMNNSRKQAYKITEDSIACDFTDEFLIRSYLQLINDLLKGYVQFDHIHPLINRIKALKNNIQNVIELKDVNNESDCEESDSDNLLQVISFRKCKQDIKKVLPLIIAKSYYEDHKQYSDDAEIKKTLHFIIDEAHNILSYESTREEESWKDYRLELFEEIIKEGRKFGVFMSISSQRPADISHTIMSQFHNFFIHRLVNDRDLALLDNAISSLDRVSKGQIPTLPIGACIITGTSFVVPFIIQIDRIDDIESRPDSDDVELDKLWGLNTEEE